VFGEFGLLELCRLNLFKFCIKVLKTKRKPNSSPSWAIDPYSLTGQAIGHRSSTMLLQPLVLFVKVLPSFNTGHDRGLSFQMLEENLSHEGPGTAVDCVKPCLVGYWLCLVFLLPDFVVGLFGLSGSSTFLGMLAVGRLPCRE
jgi:hypothetical protein